MNKQKIFFITQEEPFFIPKLMRASIKSLSEEFEVVGASILKPHRRHKSMKNWVKERSQIYTWYELIIVGIIFFYCKTHEKFISRLFKRSFYSVKGAFQKAEVQIIEAPDVNAASYVEKLKGMDIDILISVSAPQIFKKDLLDVPKKHCLNAHGTLLPRHRGVFGSFWVLYCQDKEAGITVHTMEEKLDAGEIVWQQAFDVENNDTQYSLAFKTKKMMSKGLIETCRNIGEDKLKSIKPYYEMSYRRAPEKEDGDKFHLLGKRVIKFRDIKYALKKHY